ncbi:site-2 protease family protein [Streptomyces sp. NRRL F-5123]|uniref:site-2 protease family protein n=1 Tax=Streptomyces sp. NRRL F-5123 TaxID=1463856 RepID=UPI0006949C76|nr:site-2 protease family protein [Streptomyces sp. NRRL F-5123]
MNGSLPLGRIAGVPLRLHWSAPLLVAVLAYGLGRGVLPDWAPGHSGTAYGLWAVGGALLLTLSLLAHEAAHALVARRSGVDVKDVTVFALGGVTRMGTATTARTAGLIAAVGPLTSALLGGVFLAAAVGVDAAPHGLLPAAVLAWAGWANILLAAFNLLPASPLDGGRILQAVVWRLRGDRDRAARVAGRCGQVAGALMVVGGWLEFLAGSGSGLWLALLGLFVAAAAGAEVRRSALAEAVRGVRVGDVMRPAVTGQDWQTVDRFLTDTAPGAAGQPVVPVTDLDGRPTGVIEPAALRAGLAGRTAEVRVRDLAAPLASCTLAGPDEQVGEVLEHGVLTAGRPVLVLADGRVVGMITVQDILGLMQRGKRPHPPAWHPPTTHRAGHSH